MAEDRQVELIVKYHGGLEGIATTLGAQVEHLYQGYAILTIDPDQIENLYTYPQIEHIELPKILSLEASNLVSTCVQGVQFGPLWGLRGQGVLVAVIDSGVDYRHPDFRYPDGSSRIRYIWDQTAIDGTPPSGFLSGAEYDKALIDVALATENPLEQLPFIDSNGHGTAVAGIATGNGRGGSAMGVAPEAELLVVKLGSRGYDSFARTTELMRAVKYVIERARFLEKPMAINLSVGMNNGSHRGDSLFETYLDDSAAEWKSVIVVPTGNEGAAGHHFSTRLQSFQTRDVEFFTGGGIATFYVTLWKDFVDTIGVELILPNGRSTGVLNVQNQSKMVQDGNLRVGMLYGQPSHYSSSQQIYIEVSALEGSIAPGLWRLRLQTGEIVDGWIDAWLPTLEAVGKDTFFGSPSESNTLTIPSTARKVVTVAGYRDSTNGVLDFSGKGPTPFRNPDLAAPAADILASKSGGGYDAFTGTSFAAPFVTGASALMMQWGIVRQNDPFLYGERVKAFLRLGATRSPDRDYPNITWGYGTLCLERSMDFLKQYKSGGGKFFWTVM